MAYDGKLLLGEQWAFTATKEGNEPQTKKASVRKTPEVIEVELPEVFFEGNPEAIAYEWMK